MEPQLLVQILLGITGFLLVYIGNKVSRDLEKLTLSVSQLNERMIVVVEKISHHEGRITNLENKEKYNGN